ncbi:MAG: hypothetical protein M3Z84_09850 [Actinomycetota bacterium]|nr:hypothetical protein [Actinomycetota bacterium]
MRASSQVVLEWLHAIFDEGDVAAAWRVTDEPYRLARAQAWILANADLPELLNENRDEVAAALATPKTSHPLWDTFAHFITIRLRNDLPDLTAPEFRRVIEKDDGISAGAGLEYVAVTGEQHAQFALGETLAVRLFVVRQEQLVAGLGQFLPDPGWPPTQTELPLPW